MSAAETQPLPKFVPEDHPVRPLGAPPVLSLAQRGAETPAHGTPVQPNVPSWARPRISLVKPLPRRNPGASMTDEERAISAENLVHVEPDAVAPTPKAERVGKVVGRIGSAFTPRQKVVHYTNQSVGVVENLSDPTAQAAELQKVYPNHIIWYGAATQEFWVIGPDNVLRSYAKYESLIQSLR